MHAGDCGVGHLQLSALVRPVVREVPRSFRLLDPTPTYQLGPRATLRNSGTVKRVSKQWWRHCYSTWRHCYSTWRLLQRMEIATVHGGIAAVVETLLQRMETLLQRMETLLQHLDH